MRPTPAPLPGGTAIWVFMAVEVLTFGMFLLHHAYSWTGQVEVYLQSQAQLHVGSATRGTAMLLVGSWAAYQGVLACENGSARASKRWFVVTALLGLLFSGNKIVEYAGLDGVTLSTNGFWFSYLFLTGLHLLHVVGGVVAFFWLAFAGGREPRSEGEGLLAVQAAGAYWHLIDIVWLLLFPILYLMHP